MNERPEQIAFSDVYQIPDAITRGRHSKALTQFLRNWFGDSWALTRGEVDLTFLNELTLNECEIAKDLLRRNLKLGYTHVIEGVAALGDFTAVPLLREMLTSERDASRQLTIAGALWKLTKDPAFVDHLERMVGGRDATRKQAHFQQILWLGDERGIDFLIRLLDDVDSFVRYLALLTLNELESEQPFAVPKRQLPHGSDYYRSRRDDSDFRAMMVVHLQARNGAMGNGR